MVLQILIEVSLGSILAGIMILGMVCLGFVLAPYICHIVKFVKWLDYAGHKLEGELKKLP